MSFGEDLKSLKFTEAVDMALAEEAVLDTHVPLPLCHIGQVRTLKVNRCT